MVAKLQKKFSLLFIFSKFFISLQRKKITQLNFKTYESYY